MKDLKYLAAFTIPIAVFLSVYYSGYLSFTAPIYAFIFLPLLELFVSVDTTNLDKKTSESKLKNKLFDWLLYLNLPIVYGLIFFALQITTTRSLERFEYIGLAISIGILLAVNGINVAHELCHRQASKERFIGKALLLPSFYMHFYIEHNFGHHLHAATPEDPATAKYNQSVYSFWFTSRRSF